MSLTSFWSGTAPERASCKIVGRHPHVGYGVLGYYPERKIALEQCDIIRQSGGEAKTLPHYPEPTRRHGFWLLVDALSEREDVDHVAVTEEEALDVLEKHIVETLFISDNLGLGGDAVSLLKRSHQHGTLPSIVVINPSPVKSNNELISLLNDYRYNKRYDRLYPEADPVHFWKRLKPGERRTITVQI